MKNRGQALAEFLIGVPVIAGLLAWGIPLVMSALQEKSQARQVAQLSLAQAQLRKISSLDQLDEEFLAAEFGLRLGENNHVFTGSSREYAFASAMQPIEFLMRRENGLAMATDNLWEVTIAGDEYDWLSYYRLADDWSPVRKNMLQDRPAALLGTSLLNNSLIQSVQRIMGSLPIARELGPEQLRLGYIDVDVVPAEAHCEDGDNSSC